MTNLQAVKRLQSVKQKLADIEQNLFSVEARIIVHNNDLADIKISLDNLQKSVYA